MILQHIIEQEPLSRHDHEVTFLGDFLPHDSRQWIVKVTRAPQHWKDLLLPQRASHWGVLAKPQRHALGLSPDHVWMYHARPWIPGTPLTHDVLAVLGWRNVMVGVAQHLAALHSAHTPHGDLKPEHVIVKEDGDLRFIDLPLFAVSPHDSGQVLGSAALMAPELWTGSRPTLASDVYALGCMLAWSAQGRWPLSGDTLAQWAHAHQHGARVMDADALPQGHLRGLIERMLSVEADRRPPLQHVIDALIDDGARAPSPVRVDIAHEHARAFGEGIVESLTDTSIVGLIAPVDAGSAHVLEHIDVQLRLMRRAVWRFEGGHFCASLEASLFEPEAPSNPWRPLLDLVRSGTGDAQLAPGPGDESYLFDWFTRQVSALSDATGVVMVWGDVDRASADVQAWLAQWIARGDNALVYSASCALDGVETTTHTEIPQPTFDAWTSWRATHPDAQLRDLSVGEWTHLFAQHGDRIGAMHRAIESMSRPESGDKSPDSSGDVCVRMEHALHYRAYRDVLAMAQHIPLMEHTPQTLQLWTRAALAARVTRVQLDELVDALNAHTSQAPTLRVLQWEILSRMGRHREAQASLDTCQLDGRLSPPWDRTPLRWTWARWNAQVSLSLGQFDRSMEVAQQAITALEPTLQTLSEALTNEDLAYLHVLAHGGLALRANAQAVEALLVLGPQLEDAGVPALLCAKCYGYAALGLARLNQLDASTDAHLRALEYVEREGLRGELPLYLLNVGTSYHRQGRLGLAREYYARGTRMARDTPRASTQALLLVNQANIDMILGRFDEAYDLIERARVLASAHDLAHIHVATLAFEGYILHKRGDSTQALSFYDACLSSEEGMSHKLRAELMLQRAEVFVDQGAQARAQHALREARALIEAHDLDDLRNTHGILSARVQWLDGSSVGRMGGIELFRRHVGLAQAAGDHKLILQQSPHLIGHVEREDLKELREEIVEVARSARNAVAMGLTRELRQDFFASLPTFELAPDSIPVKRPTLTTSDTTPSDMERFYRMLSLNEVILKAQDLEHLWPTALEIAMSLSGAERGFLLLGSTQEDASVTFDIVASRDVDASPIAQPHLNVSLTIAQEAAQTGRTVVTLNAREDRRFNVALSVVDLDLTSVLCVPVRDAHEVLGALYLDHRVHPGVFGGEVPRMMEAFGHQLALAITSARQVEALRAERARLRDAQRELQALLDERDLRLEHMSQRLEHMAQEAQRRHADGGLQSRFKDIAFVSTAMERALAHADRVAGSDIPVVIHGESGTGKELVARAIHGASPRAGGPFVAFNCGAISATLFESEMFGHIKGAFTGAHAAREGLMASANGGTLFLDEVAEMPLEMQAKMLRVLQERRVRPVGAAQTQPIDVRIVCATHQDLKVMVAAQTFREDLYYRLAGFGIELPALRERREDIPIIAHALLQKIAPRIAGRSITLSAEAGVLISGLAWPGNVRQLENALSAACVMTQGDVLRAHDFVMVPGTSASVVPGTMSAMVPGTTAIRRPSKRGRKPKATRQQVLDALHQMQGGRERAAEHLGVSLRTFYRYLSAYDLHD